MSDATADDVKALVMQYRPMAQRLARRYSHGVVVDPDLNQVADLGLFLAASRYDPDTGPFRPYAMATIVGELKKHLRSHGWTAKVPRRLQEASITVNAATERLEQRLKRSPTPDDIAAETGLSQENVLLALQVRNARFAAEPPAIDPAADETPAQSDVTIDVRRATSQLTAECQELLGLRFNEELTQREIAARLDISQSQVHRRLSAVLDELRGVLADSREGDE